MYKNKMYNMYNMYIYIYTKLEKTQKLNHNIFWIRTLNFEQIHSFVHLLTPKIFIECLYYMSSIVLGTGETAVNKKDASP